MWSGCEFPGAPLGVDYVAAASGFLAQFTRNDAQCYAKVSAARCVPSHGARHSAFCERLSGADGEAVVCGAGVVGACAARAHAGSARDGGQPPRPGLHLPRT